MKHGRYLGEFGTELRMNLPDERVAELVAEIAGHLDATNGDPVDELGPPTELARTMAATEPGVRRHRMRLIVTSTAVFVLTMFGMVLLFGGSPIDIGGAAPPLLTGALIGGLSVPFGGQMRDALRGGSRKPMVLFVAVAVAVMMVGVAVESTGALDDRTLAVPGGRLTGLVIFVLAFGASFLVLRPLRFAPETGLKTDLLGRVSHRG